MARERLDGKLDERDDKIDHALDLDLLATLVSMARRRFVPRLRCA